MQVCYAWGCTTQAVTVHGGNMHGGTVFIQGHAGVHTGAHTIEGSRVFSSPCCACMGSKQGRACFFSLSPSPSFFPHPFSPDSSPPCPTPPPAPLLQFYKSVLFYDSSNVEAIACLASQHFYTDQPEIALR